MELHHNTAGWQQFLTKCQKKDITFKYLVHKRQEWSLERFLASFLLSLENKELKTTVHVQKHWQEEPGGVE